MNGLTKETRIDDTVLLKKLFLKEAKWFCFHKLARGILVATAGV